MNYVDKASFKRSGSNDDQPLERLSKTFYEGKDKEESAKKPTTARTGNPISSYGSEERGSSGLKEVYFREK